MVVCINDNCSRSLASAFLNTEKQSLLRDRWTDSLGIASVQLGNVLTSHAWACMDQLEPHTNLAPYSSEGFNVHFDSISLQIADQQSQPWWKSIRKGSVRNLFHSSRHTARTLSSHLTPYALFHLHLSCKHRHSLIAVLIISIFKPPKTCQGIERLTCSLESHPLILMPLLICQYE